MPTTIQLIQKQKYGLNRRTMEHLGLRTALIDYLEASGYIEHPEVKNALLEIPRHKFVEGNPFEVYSDQALVVKSKGNKVISTISQPAIVAHMLGELGVKVGDKILEIGTGLGYNAALLGSLTGEEGMVVTVEYDQELASRAAINLVNYTNVQSIHGDGRLGLRDHAPYNKIISTVTAKDIYPEWQQQLSTGGKLLLPLEIVPGVTRLLKLNKNDSGFTGSFGWPVNFVEMTGEVEQKQTKDPDDILIFVQKQDLTLREKEALLFYCLLFNGDPSSALSEWQQAQRPYPEDFTVQSGRGKLSLKLSSLELSLLLDNRL
jgi:protein-L-isoaspartate(D-aspartate) O-methyltransferase